ncbi:MAG: hypothetical protein LQ338_006143 [Usnochroma carphineum]|nr:MAG: hypothetical protein LQ338_006143 [Usnochroma carphineum]
MPLILISGYPSSGKTYRSNQLVEFLNSKIKAASEPRISRLNVVHINDQILGLNRDVYREARSEKDARAAEYSAVKRALGRDTLVIADGLNYIKGFRYQLYCEAKAVQTPSCVIHVGTPLDKCKAINAEFLANDKQDGGYPNDVFDNLVFRYEEPNGMTRWDSPLFTVPYDDATPPCEEIWNALIGTEGEPKKVKPNQATVIKPAAASDYLYELDKSTQDILNAVIDWQKDHFGEVGGQVAVDNQVIELPPSPVALPQLQRIRRQFISLNRHHNLPKSRIHGSFIVYLNSSFGSTASTGNTYTYT